MKMTKHTNGLHKAVVELELMSGVTVHVTPPSQLLLVALDDKARELYPDVDKSPYMITPEDAVAGLQILDENNPEYVSKLAEVRYQRTLYRYDACYDLCLTFPQGKDTILAHFAPELAAIKRYVDVDDDWKAVLRYCVLAQQEDVATVNSVIAQRLPLTGGEIDDAVRIFRPALRRDTDSALSSEKSAPPGAAQGA